MKKALLWLLLFQFAPHTLADHLGPLIGTEIFTLSNKGLDNGSAGTFTVPNSFPNVVGGGSLNAQVHDWLWFQTDFLFEYLRINKVPITFLYFPLMIQGRLPFQIGTLPAHFIFGGGAQFGLRLSGSGSDPSRPAGEDQVEAKKQVWHAIGGVGLEVQVDPRLWLQINSRFTFSLTSYVRIEDQFQMNNFKDSRIHISVGILFDLSKKPKPKAKKKPKKVKDDIPQVSF